MFYNNVYRMITNQICRYVAFNQSFLYSILYRFLL